jgi:hypothetical protein
LGAAGEGRSMKIGGAFSWKALLQGGAGGFAFCAVVVAFGGGDWRLLVLQALACLVVAWLVPR